MMKRRIIPIVLVIAAAGLALTACMRDDATVQATPAPTASFAPDATGSVQNDGAAGLTDPKHTGADDGSAGTDSGSTGNTAATADGALTPFDWTNSAANVEKAIGQLSEVADARVVVTNTTALVGVKFDAAYKGEMTERIREMVAAEVMKADPSIQTVAVTANAEDTQKVYELSDQIRSGRTADELAAEINSIVRNATTLR